MVSTAHFTEVSTVGTRPGKHGYKDDMLQMEFLVFKFLITANRLAMKKTENLNSGSQKPLKNKNNF